MREFGLQPDAYTYGHVLHALGQGGQWRRAVALLRDMRTQLKRQTTAAAAAAAVTEAADTDTATTASGTDTSTGAVDTASTTAADMTAAAASAGAAAGDAGTGAAAAVALVKPNEYCYRAVLQACAQAKQSAVALQVLNTMGKRDAPAASMSCVKAALTACCDSGAWSTKGSEMFYSIQQRFGFEPDGECYRIAIRGALLVRAVDDADRLHSARAERGERLTAQRLAALAAAAGSSASASSADGRSSSDDRDGRTQHRQCAVSGEHTHKY
eukprot:5383-Heterococcus_DN1.PRE.5